MIIETKYSVGDVFIDKDYYNYKIVTISDIRIYINRNIDIQYCIDGKYVSEESVEDEFLSVNDGIEQLKFDCKNYTPMLDR